MHTNQQILETEDSPGTAAAEAGGPPAKAEFEAIEKTYEALEPLSPQGRARVVKYIISLMEIGGQVISEVATADDSAVAAADEAAASAPTYSSFADLYNAADPTTNGDKALVAGYWLQVCEQNDTFTAQAANNLLTHLGHRIANITVAFGNLQQAKPALVLQVSKSGKSQQARKTLKLSRAGIIRVEEMIGANNG